MCTIVKWWNLEKLKIKKAKNKDEIVGSVLCLGKDN
jgi:hypothetical protein